MNGKNLAATWTRFSEPAIACVENCLATICRIPAPEYYHVGGYRLIDQTDYVFYLDPLIRRAGDDLEFIFFP